MVSLCESLRVCVTMAKCETLTAAGTITEAVSVLCQMFIFLSVCLVTFFWELDSVKLSKMQPQNFTVVQLRSK